MMAGVATGAQARLCLEETVPKTVAFMVSGVAPGCLSRFSFAGDIPTISFDSSLSVSKLNYCGWIPHSFTTGSFFHTFCTIGSWGHFDQLGQASGMKKSKDPFEIAFEEQEESPPASPVGVDENEAQTSAGSVMIVGEDDTNANVLPTDPSIPASVPVSVGTAGPIGKNKEDDDDDEEENMDVELAKLRASGDPAKTAKMHY